MSEQEPPAAWGIITREQSMAYLGLAPAEPGPPVKAHRFRPGQVALSRCSYCGRPKREHTEAEQEPRTDVERLADIRTRVERYTWVDSDEVAWLLGEYRRVRTAAEFVLDADQMSDEEGLRAAVRELRRVQHRG